MQNDEKEKTKKTLSLDETFPHQIYAPDFKGTGVKMDPPFVNRLGVTIGDSSYASENSPLENWSKDTDPSIMAGEEWVHPTNDIGWNTIENRELLKDRRKQKAYPFMHPTKDAGYVKD